MKILHDRNHVASGQNEVVVAKLDKDIVVEQELKQQLSALAHTHWIKQKNRAHPYIFNF